MLHQSSRPCSSAPIAGTRLALSRHTCTRHRLAGRRPIAALRRHVLAHAQRRRLFGVSACVSVSCSSASTGRPTASCMVLLVWVHTGGRHHTRWQRGRQQQQRRRRPPVHSPATPAAAGGGGSSRGRAAAQAAGCAAAHRGQYSKAAEAQHRKCHGGCGPAADVCEGEAACVQEVRRTGQAPV